MVTHTCWHFVQIVRSYKTNKKLEEMLQNMDIYVTPVINVDGYIFTWVNDSVSSSLSFLWIQQTGLWASGLLFYSQVTWTNPLSAKQHIDSA